MTQAAILLTIPGVDFNTELAVKLWVACAVGAWAFLIGFLPALLLWRRERRIGAIRLRRVGELEREVAVHVEKLRWIEALEAQMRDSFKALASDVLQANTAMVSDQARRDLDSVVAPLRENLSTLDGHVRNLEKAREGAYQMLTEQLHTLREGHSRLNDTTTMLRQALQSPGIRGKWGELALERVLQMAGMVKNIHYKEQQTLAGGGRPDVVAMMPNGGVIPVDSKFQGNAYLEAVQATDQKARKAALNKHAADMRACVKELASRGYRDQFESAPDFVVMFVPNEAYLAAAFEANPDLNEFAIDNKVLICSPVTLLALLRTVVLGWQQKQMNESALEIARVATVLYDRFGKFIERLAGAGKSLKGAVEKYNQAVRALDQDLIPVASRLRECGVSAQELAAPDRVDPAVREPRRLPLESDTDSEAGS